MKTMIPAWTYGQVWRRYERYCHKKKLDPFSDVARAVWTYDLSIQSGDELIPQVEVEIIADILSVAKRIKVSRLFTGWKDEIDNYNKSFAARQPIDYNLVEEADSSS